MRFRRLQPRALAALSIFALAASASPALAHTGEEIAGGPLWAAWDLTPDIVVPTLLVAGFYVAGMVRRRSAPSRISPWRHVMFFAGLAAIFLSLESPVDALADHLFFAHQIQHLLLRMLGPMLLALSWPAAMLTAGTPRALRRAVVAPVVSNGPLRAVLGAAMRPATVTVLFIAALYVWQIPAYHNLAVLNEPVHYAMHITMLLAGLMFWWRIFDRRPPVSPFDMDNDQPWWWLWGPGSAHGVRHGVRLMMIWIVTLSNIILGAYTALKPDVLYPAYDVAGRLFDYPALADEQIGGFIIWMPSSMMCLVAALLLIHWMAERETELDLRRRALAGSNLAAALIPRTAAELIARARPKNRSMAVGLSLFVASVFVTAILMGVAENPSGFMGQPAHPGVRMAHAVAAAP